MRNIYNVILYAGPKDNPGSATIMGKYTLEDADRKCADLIASGRWAVVARAE